MSSALFVGRFQPFHKGHLYVIRSLAKRHEKIIIIIGSAQEKRSKENPFSAGERKEMIKRVLAKEGISYELHAVKDYFDCKKWVKAIKRLCKFDVVYSTNPWTIRCFEQAGIEVRRHRVYKRYMLSGTKIRELMEKGKEWQSYVPKEVYEFIKNINSTAKR